MSNPTRVKLQRVGDVAIWITAVGMIAVVASATLGFDTLLFCALPVTLLGGAGWFCARGILVLRHGVGPFWLTNAIAPDGSDPTIVARKSRPLRWVVGGGYLFLGTISGIVGLATLIALPFWLSQ